MSKTSLVLLIILVALVVTGCGNNNPTVNVAASDSVREAKYQAGIKLIEQEKWDEATTKIIRLHDDSYKNSIVLYNYASAKKETQKQNFTQAAYYMGKIPDAYNGELKEQILAFKKECIEKANKLSQTPVTQSTPTPQKISTPTATQSVITGKDNGYRWIAATYDEKESLCRNMADIANKNKMSSKTITWQYLYDALNATYDTSEPGILNQQIAEMATMAAVMR